MSASSNRLTIKPHRYLNAKSGSDHTKYEIWEGEAWVGTFTSDEAAREYVEWLTAKRAEAPNPPIT